MACLTLSHREFAGLPRYTVKHPGMDCAIILTFSEDTLDADAQCDRCHARAGSTRDGILAITTTDCDSCPVLELGPQVTTFWIVDASSSSPIKSLSSLFNLMFARGLTNPLEAAIEHHRVMRALAHLCAGEGEDWADRWRHVSRDEREARRAQAMMVYERS